jgi:hypothetical protein
MYRIALSVVLVLGISAPVLAATFNSDKSATKNDVRSFSSSSSHPIQSPSSSTPTFDSDKSATKNDVRSFSTRPH